MINYKLVKEILLYLEKEGWSELIDERWSSEVINEITKKFPRIDENTLNYVLKIVLY